jgi:tetratricopeptide (TPR) repeat protein
MDDRKQFFNRIRVGAMSVAALAALYEPVCHAGEREQIEADMQAHRWTQAQAELDQVIAKHPDNATAHYWLAQVDYKLGQFQAASDEAKRALQLDPSEKFTTNLGVLTQLLQAGDAHRGAGGLGTAALPPVTAPVAPAASHRSGFSWGWILAALVLGGLFWVVVRRTTGAALGGERTKWEGALRQARADLEDAIASSDANPSVTPEVRLANYDRAKKAQSAIAAHEATLATRRDFSETAELVARSHDIAAEIRGEERPSDHQARLEEQRAAAPVYMNTPPSAQTGWGSPLGMGSGLGSVAAGAAGVAAGVLLAEAAEGATRRHDWVDTDDRNRLVAPDPADLNLDLGSGDNSGGGDWDTGGGGGGDVDLGGGGDF